MDFKKLLSQLDHLNEADVKHKGSYGTSYQGDDDEDDDKKTAPASTEKRGRGRPKKAGGAADTSAKYSGAKDLQSMMVGNIPKDSKELKNLPKTKNKLSDEEPKKKKSTTESLKDWIATIDEQRMLAEAGLAVQPIGKPGQNFLIKDPANPSAAITTSDPAVVDAAKKGTLSMQKPGAAPASGSGSQVSAMQEDEGSGSKEELARRIYDLEMSHHGNYGPGDPKEYALLDQLKAQFAQQFPGENAFRIGSEISRKAYAAYTATRNAAKARQDKYDKGPFKGGNFNPMNWLKEGSGSKEELAKQIYDLGMSIHNNLGPGDPNEYKEFAQLKAQFAQQFPGEDPFKIGGAASSRARSAETDRRSADKARQDKYDKGPFKGGNFNPMNWLKEGEKKQSTSSAFGDMTLDDIYEIARDNGFPDPTSMLGSSELKLAKYVIRFCEKYGYEALTGDKLLEVGKKYAGIYDMEHPTFLFAMAVADAWKNGGVKDSLDLDESYMAEGEDEGMDPTDLWKKHGYALYMYDYYLNGESGRGRNDKVKITKYANQLKQIEDKCAAKFGPEMCDAMMAHNKAMQNTWYGQRDRQGERMADQIRQQNNIDWDGTLDESYMAEGKDEGKPGKNFAKIAKSAAKRYGSKEAGERVAGAVRAKLAKQGKLEEAALPTHDGDAGAGLGAGRSNYALEGKKGMAEAKNHMGETEYNTYAGWKAACRKAGADKFEGDRDICQAMKDGKGIGEWDGASGSVYDDSHKKKKMAEGQSAKRDNRAEVAGKKVTKDLEHDEKKTPTMAHIKKMCKDGKTVAQICKMHPNCNQAELKKMVADCKKKMVAEGMDQRLEAARSEGRAHGLRGHQHCGNNYDDMEEARCYHDGYKAGLDECYGQMPIQGYVGEESDQGIMDTMDYDAELDEMDKTAYMKQQAIKTPGNTFNAFGQTMHDSDVLDEFAFESLDRQLNALLNEDSVSEGMTVSISKGQENSPDSVSINASDAEADSLLAFVKQAGLGIFGGDDHGDMQDAVVTSAPSIASSDAIEVVDDHDGMLSLIRKMAGQGAAQPAHDHSAHDHSSEDYADEEETCNECGMAYESCGCDESVVDEGLGKWARNAAVAGTLALGLGGAHAGQAPEAPQGPQAQQSMSAPVKVERQTQATKQLQQYINVVNDMYKDSGAKTTQVPMDGQIGPATSKALNDVYSLLTKVQSQGDKYGGNSPEALAYAKKQIAALDKLGSAADSSLGYRAWYKNNMGLEEMESEDQMTYNVAEDNPPDTSAAETEQEVQDTAQANNSAASFDKAQAAPQAASDLATESEDDEEGGYDAEGNQKLGGPYDAAGHYVGGYRGHDDRMKDRELDEEEDELEESYANGADDTFESDIEFMTNIISGGANQRKSTGQTTIPVVSTQLNRLGNPMTESTDLLTQWKKLSGI
jgi:hypothetical protein